MFVSSSINIGLEYERFKKLLIKDYPYELGPDVFDRDVESVFMQVYSEVREQHARTRNTYYSTASGGIVNLAYLDHYLILCYRFAHAVAKHGFNDICADAAYYSSRIRTSTDIYYRSEIGKHFLPSHPIGAVIDSRSIYGVGFRLYNGVHIGPYGVDGKEPSEWVHPHFGDGVIVYANSKIYGKTVVGDNVTISPGVSIVNETIPNNCIVFGASPYLKVVPNRRDNLAIFDL